MFIKVLCPSERPRSCAVGMRGVALGRWPFCREKVPDGSPVGCEPTAGPWVPGQRCVAT